MQTISEQPKRHVDRRLIAARKTKTVFVHLFRALLLIGLSYIVLYPILFMLSTALRGPEDYYDPTVIWLPIHFSVQSFADAFKLLDFWHTGGMTLAYSLLASVIECMMCALTGYGLSRFRFKGKGVIVFCVILTIIVPVQSIIVPLYEQYRFFDFFGIAKLIGLVIGKDLSINLTNSIWIYVLPALFASGLRSGLFTLVFMQSFKSFPVSVEEAALIDGCGNFRCYRSIILPNAMNAIVTVFLFCFVWHWNDYYYSGMLMAAKSTLSLALRSLPITANSMLEISSDPVANAVCVQAGCLLMILPLMILFFIGQKNFVESVERTGLVE